MDFKVYHDGSVCLLTPNTEATKDWVRSNVDYASCWMGSSIVVETHYIDNLCRGILADGLSIEKDGMEMFIGENEELCVKGKSNEAI